MFRHLPHLRETPHQQLRRKPDHASHQRRGRNQGRPQPRRDGSHHRRLLHLAIRPCDPRPSLLGPAVANASLDSLAARSDLRQQYCRHRESRCDAATGAVPLLRYSQRVPPTRAHHDRAGVQGGWEEKAGVRRRRRGRAGVLVAAGARHRLRGGRGGDVRDARHYREVQTQGGTHGTEGEEGARDGVRYEGVYNTEGVSQNAARSTSGGGAIIASCIVCSARARCSYSLLCLFEMIISARL